MDHHTRVWRLVRRDGRERFAVAERAWDLPLGEWTTPTEVVFCDRVYPSRMCRLQRCWLAAALEVDAIEIGGEDQFLSFAVEPAVRKALIIQTIFRQSVVEAPEFEVVEDDAPWTPVRLGAP